jgi:hypothetical protein
MPNGRPSYSEIIVAYIEEGYRAWQTREDDASAVAVEGRLGLSPIEGIDWHRELAAHGLIIMHDALNALGAYRLAPRGLAFAERLPDLQRLLTQQTAAINASPAANDEEKRQAGFSVRDEVYKTAISKGADVAIQNAGAIWNFVRTLYAFIPPDWRPR